MKKDPLPLDHLSPEVCRNIQYLFTDIDGTITEEGLLPADAYEALWNLSEAGIHVVPVTGRPAGWCDLIARMWPVTAVIGENGSFYYAYNRATRKMTRFDLINEQQRAEGYKKLATIKQRVLKEIPRAGIAADQSFRNTDLAIDYREDITPPLSREEIEGICRIISEEGAVYKVSDIHVNCWYGDFDKLSCVKAFIKNSTHIEFDRLQSSIIYVGDSPNDEPMFKAVRHSVGVRNIEAFLDSLTSPPTYITEKKSAKGFCQLTDRILASRNS